MSCFDIWIGREKPDIIKFHVNMIFLYCWVFIMCPFMIIIMVVHENTFTFANTYFEQT